MQDELSSPSSSVPPPHPSADSVTVTTEQTDTKHLETQPLIREQDRFLPIANVSRIMKRAVHPNAKIAKGAKETVQECVSEFIGFITSEASEITQHERRKTITADDLVLAMKRLGFGRYIPYLEEYLVELKKVGLKPRPSKPKDKDKVTSGSKRQREEEEKEVVISEQTD